jgi:hypothetical protein
MFGNEAALGQAAAALVAESSCPHHHNFRPARSSAGILREFPHRHHSLGILSVGAEMGMIVYYGLAPLRVVVE